MKKYVTAQILLVLMITGCAGVNIKSISKEQAAEAHTENGGISGYIVYEPLVVVEVSQKDVCVKKDNKGNCVSQETRCSAGTPFVLPDYSKPYVVDVKSGFGKAGVEVTLTDGWRLGSIKDNSDNTAILGAIEKIIPFGFDGTNTGDNCKAPGLYRVTLDGNGIALSRILSY